MQSEEKKRWSNNSSLLFFLPFFFHSLFHHVRFPSYCVSEQGDSRSLSFGWGLEGWGGGWRGRRRGIRGDKAQATHPWEGFQEVETLGERRGVSGITQGNKSRLTGLRWVKQGSMQAGGLMGLLGYQANECQSWECMLHVSRWLHCLWPFRLASAYSF